jgi:NitT/TauT family transport system substrate-binding protein
MTPLNATRFHGWKVVFAIFFGSLASDSSHGIERIRLGFFPNITHAQALYAKATGYYETNINASIKWQAFNAGPSAIESLFADAIDATFVGPNPAINGFLRSHGEKFVIVCGAASGGAALVVREGSGIKTEKDFASKIVASPQLGNTQDVAARVWLAEKGYKLKDRGGNVTLIPLTSSDQLTLFKKNQLDAAWTIEPWVSRLELEAKGRILLEEKSLWPEGKYVTTHLVVNRAFLREKAALIKALIRAHVELTEKMNADKKGFERVLNDQIKQETTRSLKPEVLERALERVELTWDPLPTSLYRAAESAHKIGFIREKPDLRSIYDLTILNEILAEKKLKLIQK